MSDLPVCRTCLSKDDTIMHSIFETIQIGAHLLTPGEVLSICTQLTIDPKDMLPKKICKNCLEHITNAYNFNIKSLEAQTIFQNVLKSNINCLDKTDNKVVIKAKPPKISILNDIKLKKDTIKIVSKLNTNLLDGNVKEVKILPKINNDVNKQTVLWIEQPNIISNLSVLPNISPKIPINTFNLNQNTHLKGNLDKMLPISGHLCKSCGKQFISDECLQTHMQQVHLDIKICSICNVKFDNMENLSKHNLEVHFPSKNNRKYPCDNCNKNYKQKYLLERHKITAHSGLCKKPTHKCEKCEEFFTSLEDLNKHQKECNNASDEKIFCKLCKRYFSGIKHYGIHMRSHVNNVCKYCNTGFTNEEYLLNHVSLHTNKCSPYTCMSCNKEFTMKKALHKHHRIYHRTANEPFFCGHCKLYNLVGIEELQKHLESYHLKIDNNINETKIDTTNADKPIKFTLIDQQGANIVNVENLKQSINQSSNLVTVKNIISKPSNINFIDVLNSSKLFKFDLNAVESKSNLKNDSVENIQSNESVIENVKNEAKVQENKFSILHKHITNSMRNNDKNKDLMNLEESIKSNSESDEQIQCKVCSRKFIRLINLQKHMLKHKEEQLKCVGCNFTSSKEIIFKQHIRQCRVLHKNRKLICPKCGKKLTTSTGYRYHLKTHSNIRRFACPICQRSFLTMTNLKAHTQRVHSKMRSHCCGSCSRTFATLDHLNKHIAAVHSSRRHHTCKQCGRKFIQSSHLNHHMWTHTGIKPHNCPHCPNKYTAKCSLTKHLKRHHRPLQKSEDNINTNDNNAIDLESADLHLDLDNLNNGMVIDEMEDFDKINVVFIVEEDNLTNENIV